MNKVMVYCTDCEFLRTFYYTRYGGVPFSGVTCTNNVCFQKVETPMGPETVRVNDFPNMNKNNDCKYYQRHLSVWEKLKVFWGEMLRGEMS